MANTTGGQSSGREQMGGKGVASSAVEGGEHLAGSAMDRTREMQGRVSEKTDEALGNVGERMSSLAGTLRERAPKEGRVGDALDAVADRLESSGQYLSEHGISDIAQDVTSLVKRYPMQSLWIGLGVGFLVGNLASSKRY